MSAALAAALEREEGISGAVTRAEVTGVLAGRERAVAHNYHPQRSGDIYVFQSPYWFMFDRGPVAAMHGSPWGYDTHVPIIFSGPGIKAAIVNRRVHPSDVAPTLSALMGLHPPAGAQGKPLAEVLERRR